MPGKTPRENGIENADFSPPTAGKAALELETRASARTWW